MSLAKVEKIGKYDDDVASRQKLLPRWRQEVISESCVTVVGAGALGNEVVKNLILFGVGTIYVIDFDYVVASNLNRCIFFRKDDAEKKREKVLALAERAKELSPYPYVRIIPLNEDVHNLPHDHEVFQNSRVYVACLDNFAARLELNHAAVSNRKPLVDGGMSGFIGHIQVVIPHYTACLNCNMSENEMKVIYERISCSGTPFVFSGPKIPALPTTTSIIGALMAQEVVKILLGLEYFLENKTWLKETGIPLAGKRLYLNTALNVYGVYDVEKNPSCPTCSSG